MRTHLTDDRRRRRRRPPSKGQGVQGPGQGPGPGQRDMGQSMPLKRGQELAKRYDQLATRSKLQIARPKRRRACKRTADGGRQRSLTVFKHALLKDSPPTLSDKDDPQQRFFRGGVSSSMLAWSGMGSVCTQPAQFTQHRDIFGPNNSERVGHRGNTERSSREKGAASDANQRQSTWPSS